MFFIEASDQANHLIKFKKLSSDYENRKMRFDEEAEMRNNTLIALHKALPEIQLWKAEF